MNDEEFVRMRAYQLWVREGRPRGREHIHWEKARRELQQAGSQPSEERPRQQAGGSSRERT